MITKFKLTLSFIITMLFASFSFADNNACETFAQHNWVGSFELAGDNFNNVTLQHMIFSNGLIAGTLVAPLYTAGNQLVNFSIDSNKSSCQARGSNGVSVTIVANHPYLNSNAEYSFTFQGTANLNGGGTYSIANIQNVSVSANNFH